MPIAERDILICAKLLIDRYGGDAEPVTARNADHQLRRGDLAGHAVSRRILRAIDWLRRSWPANDNSLDI